MLRQHITHLTRKRTILKQAKKNKEIVYGAKAMNQQVNLIYTRPTFDWDLYSPHHKRSARQLEKSLDKKAGKDTYYTKPAQHPDTTKVMHKGFDNKKGTKDDFGIADYTKKPKKVIYKVIDGVNYVTTTMIKRNRMKALKDPEAKFRHEKDRGDLRRLKANQIYNRKLGGKKWKKKK